MLEHFMILTVHINSENGSIIRFEKRNLFDFVGVKKLDKDKK